MEISKATKIVENRALPVRRVGRSSLLYLEQAQRLWRIAIISLPVDALILLTLPPYLIANETIGGLRTLSLVCGALGLLGLCGDSLFRALELLWGTRRSVSDFRRRHGTALVVVFTVLIGIEVILHFGQFGWIVLGILAVIGIRAFRELSRLLEESQAREAAIDRDRLILLEQRNTQVFGLNVAPILAARLYGFFGAVCASQVSSGGEKWGSYLTVFVVTCAGLLALAPEPHQFIDRCPRCSRRGSRVLRSLGGCPACLREEFQIKTASAQPMSAERNLANNAPAPEDATSEPSAETGVGSAAAWLRRLTRLFKDVMRAGDKRD